ncbi:hypothetical protein DFJ67_7133 [Asanoa ferruginea]|uniref:Uncharacterized protein n=1 Tax=Asanoa ferruginea TaxID=53367 RepID=A0A3D9ZVQ0_9ACTN|nr:hypothetical protein [Asanoa ferruginea]REG01060.1 hypothetical protein DFJ67_7133 [Asanoa ferruginea]GIF47243.1 hypothetical protein Afe04nite_17820 [Asanoa ferruginea]
MWDAMRRSAFIATAALLILSVSACASPADVGAPSDAGPTGREPALPTGWRWESYSGVQVGVPGEWGWGSGSQRLGQWCIATKDEITRPIVGRPSATTLVGCPGRDDSTPRPDTLTANTGLVVGFDRTKDRSNGVEHEGDRTTVRLDGVLVIVQAPQALRERIVETIHPVRVDSFGCPATHPVGAKPDQRPAKAVSVASLRGVSAVSACKYQVADPDRPEPRLLSALRLDDSTAERAIREIAKAPLGGGPNNPEECAQSVAYGDEGIVLLVRSAVGLTEIVLRYSGCDHNGFDDGVSVRSLTATSVAPFIAGPNAVLSSFGSAKLPILRPDLTTR